MKFKRILACTLSAAMLVTTVPFANPEGGTAYAAAENDQIITEKGLAEIDSAILRDHAKAKSEQNPAEGQDGPATWAFDDEDHWWHTKWQGEQNNEGQVSQNNPIWIQTGFTGVKKIKKITYQSRNNKMGCINGYKVQYANVSGEPQDSNFQDVPGATGNLQNVNTEQAIVFNTAVDATHIRLVATSVHTNGGTPHVAAKRIRVFEETDVTYDLRKQTDFWDYELSKGTLGTQTAEDRWHYQVRRGGAWEDLPETALKNFNGAGGKSWMNDGNHQDGTYHWAKLNRNELTSTFANTYDALAFSWKAPAAGYYKATLENAITGGNSINSVVWHSSDTTNGKELFKQALGSGGTINSKIAKAAAGDWIRIGATAKDGWVAGFHPMIEICTVQDYARQYLAEVAAVEEGQDYTAASKKAVKDARTALQTAVDASAPDMADIETKLAALEAAVSGLTLHIPVTGVSLDQSELTLKVNETAALVATVEPEGAENKAVIWESNNAEVASVNEGTVTATGVGTAVITVKSAENSGLTATCTVTVKPSVNKDELTKVLEEANSLQQADYTPESWDVFNDAKVEATKVNENADATQAQVNDAVKAVRETMSALERVYTVTVDGVETARGVYNHIVTIKAAAPAEGMKFAGWQLNGKIVSYDAAYTFAITGNMNFTATYKQEEEVITKPLYAAVANTAITKRADGKANVKYVAQLSIPEGYTLNETGLLWYGKSDLSSLTTENGPAAGVKKIATSTINTRYQFAICVNGIPAGKTIRGVIYAKVTNNETQETTWVYSEEVKLTNR